jgi:two-component system, NtrC family, response regulator PilR
LLAALDKTGGKRGRAAKLLKMTFRSFRYRLAKFGFGKEGDDNESESDEEG